MRAMGAWLLAQASSYDCIYVDQAREELLVAVDATEKLETRILTRCRDGGPSSDTQWWDRARNGKRCMLAARKAHGIFVDDTETQRELLIRDFHGQRITKIPQGIDQQERVTAEDRWRIRKELARANADLVTEPDTPVLLCHSTMVHASGMEHLIRASRFLLMKYPNLRIWLVGDGPNRDAIYANLRAEGVRASVAIPGSFSDPTDIFRAANIYFQPGAEGLDFFLPLAISLRLPIVAIDHPLLRRMVRSATQSSEIAAFQHSDVSPHHSANDGSSEGSGSPSDDGEELLVWCDSSQPKSIRDGIVSVLRDLPSATRQAEKLQESMLRHRSEHQYLDAFTSAIHRLW